MNLNELKAARETAAANLNALVKSNPDGMSAEDLAKAKGYAEEVNSYDQEIKAARESQKLIASISDARSAADDSAPGDVAEKSATPGEFFVKKADAALKSFRNTGRINYQTPEFKAANDAHATTGVGQPVVTGYGTTYSRGIVNQRRNRLVAADLMGSASLSGALISYLVENPERIAEGGVTTVAEGAVKPYVRYNPFELVTEGVSKLAVLSKITDEMLADYAFIADWINQQLIYDLSVAEEDQLLNGDGAGANLRGLLNREGIQNFDIDGDPFDGLLDAQSLIPDATPLEADALLLNPADYRELRKKKDGNSQYFAGGPFQGQYGNGEIKVNPPVWGLQTIETRAVKKGTYLLGAFRQGAV
ncbi:phage major capsid protein [Corynebacterium phocae]|uniref:phage major capsid protein n=1 Tax=Corynebacterium phocae TaxID=161895 RepID=UPI000950D1B4|nr:phage major capsid protein [Corynebacterium phocae]KAA8722998.1 phage major capsid protein [Corynebacterium phocae]